MSIMKCHVTFSADRPREASAEFRIGARSLPYLADHGFQDMVVLPGSFYVEMTLCVEHEIARRLPGVMRNVTFCNPVILSAEDTVITVEVRDRGDGHVEYVFYEAGARVDGARLATRQYAAKLEIDRNPPKSRRDGAHAFSIEAFQTRSPTVIDSQQFYKTLRENGNQYGPCFQNVASIWRAGDQSLGKVTAARQREEAHHLHPCVLDSVAQLLAPFSMEKGKTFVLQSIEEIEITDVDFPDTLWAHATVLPANGGADGIVGNVGVFDESGKPYLKLSGVAFTLLDRVDVTGEKAVRECHHRVQLYCRAAGGRPEFLGRPFRRSKPHRIRAVQPDLSATAGYAKRVSPEQRRG